MNLYTLKSVQKISTKMNRWKQRKKIAIKESKSKQKWTVFVVVSTAFYNAILCVCVCVCTLSLDILHDSFQD